MEQLKSQIDQAYDRFAQKYPHWSSGWMNPEFVELRIKPTILHIWQQGREPTPLDIALLWPAALNTGTLDEYQHQLEEAAEVTVAFFSELRQVCHCYS